MLLFLPLTRAAQEDFRRALRDHRYVEGRNIVVEWRSAERRVERANSLAAELVRLNVRAIIAEFTPAVRAAKNATTTIPIIMASAGDPVATGIVPSLARPGGNITGFTNLAAELSGKRLDLLREIVPVIPKTIEFVSLSVKKDPPWLNVRFHDRKSEVTRFPIVPSVVNSPVTVAAPTVRLT